MEPKNWVECCDCYITHMSKATPLEPFWDIRIIEIHVLPTRHVLAKGSTVSESKLTTLVTYVDDIMNILQRKKRSVVHVLGIVVCG